MSRRPGPFPRATDSSPRGRVCPGILRAGLLLVLVLGGSAVPAAAQQAGRGGDRPAGSPVSWQLGLRSTGYFYQLEDTEGRRDDRFQAFQSVSGAATGLAGGRVIFRGSGRFANDLAIEPAGFQTSRLYSGYLEIRLQPALKTRIGRQFVQCGVTGLTLDGAWLSFNSGSPVAGSIWGGARSPLDSGFSLGQVNQDAAFGGRLALHPGRQWRIVFSGAYRERLGKVAARPVGMELAAFPFTGARILGRAAYDMARDHWAKVLLTARWSLPDQATRLDLQLLDRQPCIDAASWFARFTGLERVRIIRLSLRRVSPGRFGGELDYTGSFVGERSSSRLGLAFLFPLGRVGYALRLGDAGEESRFFGELAHRVVSWLSVDAQASVLTYALLADAPAGEERDLVTLAAGLRADLRPGCRLRAQVQGLRNPSYDQDVRFLLGVDLSLARGASRFGLDRGGWLQ